MRQVQASQPSQLLEHRLQSGDVVVAEVEGVEGGEGEEGLAQASDVVVREVEAGEAGEEPQCPGWRRLRGLTERSIEAAVLD